MSATTRSSITGVFSLRTCWNSSVSAAFHVLRGRGLLLGRDELVSGAHPAWPWLDSFTE